MKKYEYQPVEEFGCRINRFGKIANLGNYEVKNLQDVYCRYMGKLANGKKSN